MASHDPNIGTNNDSLIDFESDESEEPNALATKVSFDPWDDDIPRLKDAKIQRKREFTVVRRALLSDLVNGVLQVSEIPGALRSLENAVGEVRAVLMEMLDLYTYARDVVNRKKIQDEMEAVEEQFSEAAIELCNGR